MRSKADRSRTGREAPSEEPGSISVPARDWGETYANLRAADARGELDGGALELLSEAARWTGHDSAIVEPLERAHAAFTAQHDAVGAARTALALVRVNTDHCRDSVAATWLTRAAELLAPLSERREHGWLAWFRSRGAAVAGDTDTMEQLAHHALAVARRHGDRGLEAIALIDLGHGAAARGQRADAMRLAEQASAIVLAGEAGILPAGEVLCGTIWLHRSQGEWDRAQQWIDTADRWVQRQRVEYFPGMCRLHRSEVLRIRGRLDEAERESVLATQMTERSMPSLAMIAFGELGEVRRRRDDARAAMDAFGRAVQLGWDPQPGMALLLLANGHAAEALRAIERVFRGPTVPWLMEDRANLLGARTTVAVANGELDVAGGAAAALAELAGNGVAWDEGSSALARGRVEFAHGRFESAIHELTRARRVWSSILAPFELASTCVVLGDALSRAGDEQHARLAQQSARELFGRLGALRGGDGAERRLAGLAGGAPTKSPPVVVAPAAAATGPSFVREGDYWSVCFDGQIVRIKDGRGAQYLAELLARPGEPMWAIELAAGSLRGGGEFADLGDAGPLLDATARQEYGSRLRELEAELADAQACADAGRVELARAEMDALGQQLAAAVGLGGRDRRAGGAAERARQSVTKAIRAVLKRLGAEHEGLGEHLHACVRTGASCSFVPDRRQPVSWSVSRTRPSR